MYGYSLQRITLDAADVLIKTPGEPYNWENDTTTLETLGLASIVENISQSHSLDVGKVLVLNQSSGSNEVKESLRYLAGGNNIRMSLYINTDGTPEPDSWNIDSVWNGGFSRDPSTYVYPALHGGFGCGTTVSFDDVQVCGAS